MSAQQPTDEVSLNEEEGEDMLDAGDAAEEIEPDGDHPMDGDEDEGDEDTEIELANDSLAHFDLHTDSLFAIAEHPLQPNIVATGSGDDSVYVFSVADVALPDGPVLPASYESNPRPKAPRESLKAIAHLTGHSDSVSHLAFSLPDGAYLVTAGLDGKLRAHDTRHNYALVSEVQEVDEIAWLAACPNREHPHTFAFGGSDGSVWVYSIIENVFEMVQTFYQHAVPTTAGAWSPSGALLASVAEDSSLYVYDPFGEAAAAGQGPASGSQALVALTAADQRFAVEGGLYSVAIAPSGAFLAAGGAAGVIRIIGLPVLASSDGNKSGAGARGKQGGGKQAAGPAGAVPGQPGALLATLQAQTDGVETLAFAQSPVTLLAAGSVDGSIALFDCARRFAVRRLIRGAHSDEAVVQVSWGASSSTAGTAEPVSGAPGVGAGGGRTGPGPAGASLPSAAAAATASDAVWMLTSAGMDGVIRRWDARGGTAAAAMGLVKEWKGHRGGGEGGGVMGFVQGEGRIVSAGDDGVGLVFDGR